MGPLRVVYNVTSNISPYQDDSSSNSSRHAGSPQDPSPAELNSRESNNSETPLWSSYPVESASWWKYVPYALQKPLKAVIVWTAGPHPPRPWKITPFFPSIQTAPLRLVDRFFPKRRHRVAILGFFYFCWLLTFSTVLHYSDASAKIQGWGKPQLIDCTWVFWFYKNECGIDGDNCRPFTDSNFVFRCPGSCSMTEVLNPHAVGAQEPNYQPLVIGGPKNGSTRVEDAVYRADSFVCGSAIHAGYIDNQKGGCGVLSLVGKDVGYPSVRRHGITSIGFDSSFPKSFKFLENARGDCSDLQWPLLGITITFTVLLSIFTTSPAVFYASMFTSIYMHVALVSDPPKNANLYALTSVMLKGFLPAAFVAFVGYRYCASRTLNGLQAQFEKTILWLGACWVGALDNFTFDHIPLQRLTPHDISQQPGALTALIIIILVLLVIVIGQVWAFRVEGIMRPYLAAYSIMIFFLLMFLAIPRLHLRIHHYFLAMLLFPGTSLQTRPSLLYQGLLFGLFINGIARWGFASILSTSAELLADGQLGSPLPKISTPSIKGGNITFQWNDIPQYWNGISILVNDVERFRQFGSHTQNFTWERSVDGYPEYFRFAWMDGATTGDYTKAGIWHPNGTWTEMKPGAS